MQRPVAKDRPCFDTLKNLLPQEGESPVHLHQAGQITILGFSAKFRRLQKCDCRPLTSKVAQELYNLISKVSSLIYTAKSSIFYYYRAILKMFTGVYGLYVDFFCSIGMYMEKVCKNHKETLYSSKEKIVYVVGKPCNIYRLRGNPIVIIVFSSQVTIYKYYMVSPQHTQSFPLRSVGFL